MISQHFEGVSGYAAGQLSDDLFVRKTDDAVRKMGADRKCRRESNWVRINYSKEKMKSLKIKKSLLLLSLCALLISSYNYVQYAGFSINAAAAEQQENANDIVILFTNDVHCGIDDNIGYAGLVDYKQKMLEKTPYVAFVDCGDAVQGAAIGVVSKGGYIIDIMNEAGYDYAILGNHEFDYGLERISEFMDMASFKYLGCNISYTGNGKNALEGLVPYEIVDYGDKSVAFIGVSTPYSITSSVPKYFTDDDGNIGYDFCKGSGEEFYALVQGYAKETY